MQIVQTFADNLDVEWSTG